MTTGFLIGLCAAFVWSLTNIIDKYLVTQYSIEGRIGGIILLSCFFPLLLVPLAFFFSDSLFVLPIVDIITLVGSGILMVGFLFFYLKALFEDDASNVMALLQLTPILSFGFAFFILGELPAFTQLCFATLIIFGGIIVSYDLHQKLFKKKLIIYTTLASFFLAAMYSIFKYATVEEDIWASIAWRSIGMACAGIILMYTIPQYRQDFFQFLARNSRAGMAFNMMNETLTVIGDSLFAYAILFAPLVLIQTTEAYQPIFILLIVFILHQLNPNLRMEDFQRRILIQKMIGIILVIVGTTGILL